MKRIRVLFVCMGNICRSPLAEGIFRNLVEKSGQTSAFEVDSAGTGAWHVGDPPDPRSIDVAARHGVDISGQRARQFHPDDLEAFDLVLAMDRANLQHLQKIATASSYAKVALFSQAAIGQDTNIPDPYYGGTEGFQLVYTKLLAGCSRLLDALDAARTS